MQCFHMGGMCFSARVNQVGGIWALNVDHGILEVKPFGELLSRQNSADGFEIPASKFLAAVVCCGNAAGEYCTS